MESIVVNKVVVLSYANPLYKCWGGEEACVYQQECHNAVKCE